MMVKRKTKFQVARELKELSDRAAYLEELCLAIVADNRVLEDTIFKLVDSANWATETINIAMEVLQDHDMVTITYKEDEKEAFDKPVLSVIQGGKSSLH
jgi:hypothetical protein